MNYFLILAVFSTLCCIEPRSPTHRNITHLIEIHDKYCAESQCPSIRSPFSRSCCWACSCNISTCTRTGTCCPHVFEYLPTIEEMNAAQKLVCRYAQYRDYDPFGFIKPYAKGYRMIRKCAENFTDPHAALKCENYKNHRPLNFDLLLPVTDPSAKLTYENIHCAVCNHVPDQHLVRWNARLQCWGGATLHITSAATAIEEVLKSAACDITYTPPAELKPSSLQSCEPSISECNVTKNWKAYDPFIERACHAYETVFHVSFKKQNYRNVFCYECNGLTPPGAPCIIDRHSSRPTRPVLSFAAILHLKPRSSVTNDIIQSDDSKQVCLPSQVVDPIKDTCKDVTCLPPKEYLNGTCMDTFSYVESVLFEAFIQITLSQAVLITQILQPKNDSQSIIGLGKGGDLINVTQFYALYYKPVNDDRNNSDPLTSFVEYIVCHIQGKKKRSNGLSFLNGVLELNGKNDTIQVYDVLTEGSEEKPLLVYLELEDYRKAFQNDSTHLGNMTYFSQYERLYKFGTLDGNKTQVVTKTAGCPLVDISDYQLDYHPNGDLFVEELGFTFPAKAYTRNSNESVSICKSDFEVLTEKQRIAHRPRSNEHSIALGVLSLAMAVLSLICLSVTLLTYFLFKELQTQPGVNNMCLIGSLIIAQSLYQFGANQAGKIPDLFCELTGALTHFFWLMSIFWMNVCSFHMFIVFTSLNRIQRNNHKIRRTALYTIYCFLASALLVIVNVVVSSINSHGMELGYGGALCYVSDYFMNLYTFVVPVGLVVMVNLGLFVAVISTVQRLPQNLTQTETNRNYIKIYAKLSCITGVFWLCGFLVYTGVVVFEYLFIIGAAGQGVFIFVSFVCNNRITQLYRSLFRKGTAETEITRVLRLHHVPGSHGSHVSGNHVSR